jgi:anti-sigma regulatory factor (Ser/Thr protein kinase)
LLEHILENVVGSGERGDDIALLAARILPVAPLPLALRVRARVGSMDLVRDAMRAWLAGVPLERVESEGLVLATWEACANAIEHALEPTDDVVTISAEREERLVRIVVQDTGRWASPTERVDRGLGMQLIRSLASSVEIAQVNGGTRITVERTLDTEPTPVA